MTTLFISDLHLSTERPAITALFLDFLAGEARTAQALYILGDFFEYWIGDDAIAQAEYRPIVAGLRAATGAGLSIFIMHGNRDFLLGEEFAHATGCRLIPDPTRIDLYGTPVLLMHGDVLCTDDTEYLAIRDEIRTPRWKQQFLSKDITERDALARGYREQSRQSIAQKAPAIMDVTQRAVADIMRAHQVRHLIHGHTHRPAEHVFDLDGATAIRVVLGDWYEQGSILRCDAKGWTLSQLPLRSQATRSVH